MASNCTEHSVGRRVTAALEAAGPEAHLVAFDANDIQGFVMASSHPIAVEGASRIVAGFDATELARPCTVFAGGGRGIQVVPAARVEERVRELTTDYWCATHGGVLAVAAVPFDKKRQKESLAWLRLRLDAAKESSPCPFFDPPVGHEVRCESCGVRKATTSVERPGRKEKVCARCKATIRKGRSSSDRWSLEEIAVRGRVAAICADGNAMGLFFGSLETLEQMAASSFAVSEIFGQAQREARKVASRIVAPVVGGDDIRVFVAPHEMPAYVEKLAEEVEKRAEHAGDLDGILRDSQTALLSKLGIGVGAIVADSHFAAWRMVEYAYELEKSAKRACRERAWRSCFDFALLTAGDEFREGANVGGRSPRDRRPYDLTRGGAEPHAWRTSLHEACLLRRHVTRGQRLQAIAPASEEADAEFGNTFRYQVARSESWREWYAAAGFDWTDASIVDEKRPDPGLLALATVLEYGERGKRP